jgi:cytochrome c553
MAVRGRGNVPDATRVTSYGSSPSYTLPTSPSAQLTVTTLPVASFSTEPAAPTTAGTPSSRAKKNGASIYLLARSKPESYLTEKGIPLKDDTFHTPLPKGQAGEFSYHVPFSNLVMGYSKNQKAAKDFLRWICSKEIYDQWFTSQQGFSVGSTAQLQAFRDKTRADPHAQTYMWGMAARLSDPTIEGVAVYYASQTPVAGEPSASPEIAAGEKIFTEGIPSESVPACMACHGEKAEGNGPIPRLAGHHLAISPVSWKRSRQWRGLRSCRRIRKISPLSRLVRSPPIWRHSEVTSADGAMRNRPSCAPDSL